MSRSAALGVDRDRRHRPRLRDARCSRSAARSRAHYAATRSIAEGHPYIDRYANETCDLVRTNGHYYAAKGPALELWSAPFYLLLRAVGAVPANPNAHLRYPDAMAGIPLRAVWQIGLWAVVLPRSGCSSSCGGRSSGSSPGLGTRRRGDPRARDARAAVLDAALRARPGCGARVPRRSASSSAASRSHRARRRPQAQQQGSRSRSTCRSRCRPC